MIMQQKRVALMKVEEDKRRRIHSVKRDIDKKWDEEGRIK